jgi:VWFA-related protein
MTKALAVLALTAIVAQAQQPPPTIRSRVDLVLVDVVVVDDKGNAVRGLKASDFVLRDRGKPQEIATFEETTHVRPPAAPVVPLLVRADVGTNQTAQADRLVVMVVDDLHIYKERTDRAKEIAKKVLADLGPQSSMAVLFTSREHSTQVTSDQAILAGAVESLKGRQSWRRPHPAIDKQRGAGLDPEMSAEQQLAIINQTQSASVQQFFDNMTQYKTLQDAARMLGGGDTRRKAFVLISEGIGKELSGIFGAMGGPWEPPPGGGAYISGAAAGPTDLRPIAYHDDALVEMMESLRRSNVATYAIDPRGKVESKDLPRECMPPPTIPDPCSSGLTDWNSAVRQAQHGLEIMSAASGGFAVTNTDDFTSGIGRIIEDLDHYYLLGFYPTDTKGKDYRRLDVSVPGRGNLTLRFRHGYMPGAPPPPRSGRELIALSAGVLPKTRLPLRLGAVALPTKDVTSRVAIVLEVSVPRRQLEEKDGRLRDTLKYEVLVVDEKKAKVRSLAGLEAAFVLSGSADAGPAPDVASYEVSESIELAPGRYEIRVSAMSAKLGDGGSVYLPVEIPDFRNAPALGGLAIGYADGSRVPVAPRRVAPARRATGMPAPPRRELPFAPTLDRVFTSRDTLQVYVEGAVGGSARPVVAVEIVDRAGKIVRAPSPSFSVVDRIAKIVSVLPLDGLAPGAYVVRATLTDGSRAPVVRESAFEVRQSPVQNLPRSAPGARPVFAIPPIGAPVLSHPH